MSLAAREVHGRVNYTEAGRFEMEVPNVRLGSAKKLRQGDRKGKFPPPPLRERGEGVTVASYTSDESDPRTWHRQNHTIDWKLLGVCLCRKCSKSRAFQRKVLNRWEKWRKTKKGEKKEKYTRCWGSRKRRCSRGAVEQEKKGLTVDVK